MSSPKRVLVGQKRTKRRGIGLLASELAGVKDQALAPQSGSQTVQKHYQMGTGVSPSDFNDHNERHENGGADEISVAGLSGLLADQQTPLAHGPDKHSALDSTPDSDHSCNGPTGTHTAGTNLVFGDVCYMGLDGKMEKAKADVVGTSFAWVMALATINEDASGAFALPGAYVRDDTWDWPTIGQPVFLSAATAGALTQTAPSATNNIIQIIGIVVSADVIWFNPSLGQVKHT